MKIQHIIPISLIITLLAFASVAGAGGAETSAQDADLFVDPVVRVFPPTAVGVYSTAMTFTVTNKNASETRTITGVTLGGLNADQFQIETNTCLSSALSPTGGACTVTVRFHPTHSGTKGANLLIVSNDTETPTLTAYVTNFEPAKDQARKRMPPVLSAISIRDAITSELTDTMISGQTYTITWSLEGYHEDYSSMVVLFDCTDITYPNCGANYEDSSRFAESGARTPGTTTTGNWQYSGVADKRFTYTWNFTVPLKREDLSDWPSGGADIVVRFYSKDDIDLARNSSSVSLLIPGNQSSRYYDTAGRRILKTIVP